MQIYWNKRKGLHKKRVQLPKGLVWDTNIAAVSLFWDINMAAVTSCENTLYCFKPLTIEKEKQFFFFENFLCTFKRESRIIYLLFINFFMLVESRKLDAKKKENRKPQEMKPKNGIFSM